MSNPWDHLPNAKHIDRFIASDNQHRNIWYSACDNWDDIVSYELRGRSWNEVEAKCKELGRLDIWYNSKTSRILSVLALIAYDDCAHYLEYTSQELTTVALLGVAPAVLLLEAVIAFEEIAKLEVTQ